jgi:hypothetical protein
MAKLPAAENSPFLRKSETTPTMRSGWGPSLGTPRRLPRGARRAEQLAREALVDHDGAVGGAVVLVGEPPSFDDLQPHDVPESIPRGDGLEDEDPSPGPVVVGDVVGIQKGGRRRALRSRPRGRSALRSGAGGRSPLVRSPLALAARRSIWTFQTFVQSKPSGRR